MMSADDCDEFESDCDEYTQYGNFYIALALAPNYFGHVGIGIDAIRSELKFCNALMIMSVAMSCQHSAILDVVDRIQIIGAPSCKSTARTKQGSSGSTQCAFFDASTYSSRWMTAYTAFFTERDCLMRTDDGGAFCCHWEPLGAYEDFEQVWPTTTETPTDPAGCCHGDSYKANNKCAKTTVQDKCESKGNVARYRCPRGLPLHHHRDARACIIAAFASNGARAVDVNARR